MSSATLCRSNLFLHAYCKTHAACAVLMKKADVAEVLTKRTALEDVCVTTKRCASSGRSPAKMQAWQIHQYGGNEELTWSDKARAATIKSPDEILIKVDAASVNPIDVRMRGSFLFLLNIYMYICLVPTICLLDVHYIEYF